VRKKNRPRAGAANFIGKGKARRIPDLKGFRRNFCLKKRFGERGPVFVFSGCRREPSTAFSKKQKKSAPPPPNKASLSLRGPTERVGREARGPEKKPSRGHLQLGNGKSRPYHHGAVSSCKRSLISWGSAEGIWKGKVDRKKFIDGRKRAFRTCQEPSLPGGDPGERTTRTHISKGNRRYRKGKKEFAQSCGGPLSISGSTTEFRQKKGKGENPPSVL